MRALILVFPAAVLALLTACAPTPKPDAKALEPATSAAPVTGHKFQHDGVDLYYEVYGSGEPLLLIHGNGSSSRGFAAQIAYFRKKYQVIAMDSRDQGRSGNSSGKLTYEKMTDDQAALLDHLKVGAVNVIGWSDGGIEALLLASRHPEKVKKVAAMAPNLVPRGLRPDFLSLVKDRLKDPNLSVRERKVAEIMLSEPQIAFSVLGKITPPVLILAGDHDIVADEHTLDIFHHIPNAQLQIFANATHLIPAQDPDRFNAVVATFFERPFVKTDRLGDLIKFLGKSRSRAN